MTGTGTSGFSHDGGLAAAAATSGLSGVAVGPSGHVFVSAGPYVRRLDPASGIITTIAGQVDPEGMGPLDRARLAGPTALVVAPSVTLVAGGASGTIQAMRGARLEAVAGRYPHAAATGALARFRAQSFGAVGGVAFDATAGIIYLTETSANRLHAVTIVDPADAMTWTIATLANVDGTAGFADGPVATARFRRPMGLHLEPLTQRLLVADTGNHVIRAIDLSTGLATATVTTVAGTPQTRGFFGDGGGPTAALLHEPHAITRCANGDLFVADTGNHRVRRIAAGVGGSITTVLGDGIAASSGEGTPARSFPVDGPRGLACDGFGNLFVTSSSTVRLLPAADTGIVDGGGAVQTIYGGPAGSGFPASVTGCLTGVAVVDAETTQLVDECAGVLVELWRQPAP